jgi:hypothetical protein
LQAPLRRPRTCASLSWGLYPSGRPIQSPARCPGRRQDHVSLERFCSQQQEAFNHDAGRRVLAAIPPPRAASGFRPYSQLWLSGESPPRNPTAALFAIAGLSSRNRSQARSLLPTTPALSLSGLVLSVADP